MINFISFRIAACLRAHKNYIQSCEAVAVLPTFKSDRCRVRYHPGSLMEEVRRSAKHLKRDFKDPGSNPGLGIFHSDLHVKEKFHKFNIEELCLFKKFKNS